MEQGEPEVQNIKFRDNGLPLAGLARNVPRASIPISFFVASGFGLIGCSLAWVWAGKQATIDPTADQVVAAVHLGMLATLSMGVLGALHQFGPVVGRRPLRSTTLAWGTFSTWLGASWLIPIGLASKTEILVEVGGALASVSLGLVIVNLSGPLSSKDGGVTVNGLRLSLAGLVCTGCYGVVYVADRRGNWFNLSGHVVLAHALVGIFGWLGLTYVAVSERLWPMFLLAHVPGNKKLGNLAIWTIALGVLLASPGVLLGLLWLSWPGAVLLAVGLGAHSLSLANHIRCSKRPRDIYLMSIIAGEFWLLVGLALSILAALEIPSNHHTGVALVAGAIAAFGGWILTVLVGHLHKVVPFIVWTTLRTRGIKSTPDGRPLLFGNLYSKFWSRVTLLSTQVAVGSLCFGLSCSLAGIVRMAGVFFMISALVTMANFSLSYLSVVNPPTGTSDGFLGGSTYTQPSQGS